VGHAEASAEQGETLLDLYDRAMPQVYGYLVSRCGNAPTAEDLTAETFLAAVSAVKDGRVPDLSVAWLVGVARHKLVDHWRRVAREDRKLALLDQAGGQAGGEADDPWDAHIDATRARGVLERLGPHHRAALTLRYLDGLSVPEVAHHLDRTVHATEALLVRARSAFRTAYGEDSDG
jgi:RNA polymerase sigma-70 factor, ECF subfamily